MAKVTKESRRKVVKSVGRTLQILEHFDVARCPLKIVSIATALGYPQSSTAALLRSMVSMGYLDYDARTREFSPTNRVALLGSWINPELFEQGRLLQLLRSLVKRTGQLAMLASRTESDAQYIYLQGPPRMDPLHVRIGHRAPLAKSCVGIALLSTMSDKEIGQAVHTSNAYRAKGSAPTDLKETIAHVEEFRVKKYAMTSQSFVFGYGSIGTLLPPTHTKVPLALGIGARSSVMRKRGEEYARIMLEEVQRFFPDHNSLVHDDQCGSTKNASSRIGATTTHPRFASFGVRYRSA